MSEFIEQRADENLQTLLAGAHDHSPSHGNFIHTEDIFHAPAAMRNPHVLFDPVTRINRPDMNFERRFAQTPLNPNRLYTYMQPYPRILEMLLDTRLDEIFEKTNLAYPYTAAIRDEISIGFQRRYTGNEKAYHRLKDAVLQEGRPLIEQEDADLIWRAMTAGASMYDTAQLLLRYPAMASIEAAKYTQPLDPCAPLQMQEHIQTGLMDCAHDELLGLELYTDDDWESRAGRFIDVLGDFRTRSDEELTDAQRERREEQVALRKHIIATKDNIGTITDGDTVIELVRKQSFVAIDPEVKLPFTVPNAVSITLKTPDESGRTERIANVQPISTSCYWRVLPVVRD